MKIIEMNAVYIGDDKDQTDKLQNMKMCNDALS